MTLIVDTMQWAQQQFASCELGDRRRTRRLVRFAAQVAADPDANTPTQTEKWADLKAAYRLIDNQRVTFDAVAGPHWQQTRQRDEGTWLVLCDTTEVNFGATNQASGLGPLGQGIGRGFLLHSGLLVHPATEEVIGLAGQKIHYRKPAPKNETPAQRLARKRESQVWRDLIGQIDRPPTGVRFVDVCDRGADNFEVYCQLLLHRHDWVIRAAHLNRSVRYKGQKIPLDKCLRRLPLAGTYQLSYRSKNVGPRTAQIEVRFGSLMVSAPLQKSPWLREQGITLIGMNVVELREVNAPAGTEPLHWVLWTSLPVTKFEEAWTVIEYYEKRPQVEDFHKALKTGCRVEERQYEASERLEAITALLSVTAVRLLQLRSASRLTPERPAEEVVPSHWVTMLSRLRGGRRIVTVREFFRQLAGLGGHLLRKHDGEPGWITLWRGFEKLHLAIRAIHDYRNYQRQCG
jgi:hypothetical protein